jgi:hypothetical protein
VIVVVIGDNSKLVGTSQDLFNKIVMFKLKGQVAKWKRITSRVVVVDVMLVKYDTLFKEHTFLKL